MTVSISTMPPQIQQRYNAKLLSTPEFNLVHMLFATPVELPDNEGFIDRQSRYDRLELFPVPLDDSQTNPPAQQLNRVDVDKKGSPRISDLRTCAEYVFMLLTSFLRGR